MNAPEAIHERLRRAERGLAAEGRSQTRPGLGARDAFNIARDHWLAMLVIVGLALLAAAAYTVLSRPVYEANLLIQVEEPAAPPAKSIFGDAANGLETKTTASGEMEIMRSRKVIAPAVEKAKLYIEAQPRYIPLVGAWMASKATALSTPGILGKGGWVSGAERVEVGRFDVPAAFEGSRFVLRAAADNRYTVHHPKLASTLQGMVGRLLVARVPGGEIALQVDVLEGLPGAEFRLVRHARDQTVAQLQQDLRLTERGRLSGVIEASLRDTQPARGVAVLNEIGRNYVQQNLERRAAEADKMLAFLNSQLPALKAQSDQAEEAYSRYRQRKGSLATQDESRLLLERSAQARARLEAAIQRREEMATRLAANHPDMIAAQAQVDALEGQVRAAAGQIREVPALQQDSGRLERNVRSSTDLYQQMRDNALQLQLLREGRSGNVRLVDGAWSSGVPVQPKPELVFGGALLAGTLLAVLFAIFRAGRHTGMASAYEIEAQTGLTVYGAIPRSRHRAHVSRKLNGQPQWPALPFHAQRPDATALALRNLATTLQFGLAAEGRRRFLITAATADVGRSFVAANLAHLMAGAGHRVLLIDADFKDGHLHEHLGLPRTPGLAELLAGSERTEDVLRVIEGTTVVFLPAGQMPAGTSALKLMSGIPEVVERLSSRFDVVIIGGPPVLSAAETLFLATASDSILLVARSEKTQTDEIAECARRMAQWGHEISGVIVNDVDVGKRHVGESGHVYGNLAYRSGS